MHADQSRRALPLYDIVYQQSYPERDPKADGDRNGSFESDDYLDLDVDDANPTDPASVTGSFKMGVVTGEILSLKPTRGFVVPHYDCAGHFASRALPDKPLESAWGFDADWEGELRGHVLTVSTVRDDNGWPFVLLEIYYGSCGCAPEVFRLIAKTRVGKKRASPRLTKKEKERLGVGVRYEVLKMRMEVRKRRMAVMGMPEGVDDEEEYSDLGQYPGMSPTTGERNESGSVLSVKREPAEDAGPSNKRIKSE